ncbi:PAS domain S-box protein [Parvularcula sp. LCG005]|uniref:PAS domain S-box protein n=1 Tax=Parvularcula sp. LCG005 TaxID=3078805 RepID=UPI0029436D35|nr:PAS domain S-box protein [Parvularcula sp. LCG005]WOI53103.1 PAS domain S-box protein [Parvularcula sp. LCG005]
MTSDKQSLEISRLQMFSKIALTVSTGLDLQEVVQLVTDTATEWSGGKFGAFFYNVLDEQNELMQLYTVSGAPIEAFSVFDMPRKTAVFAPTFDGVSVVRSDDIRKDPRYGKLAPHYGMPKGHLPVVSYLAVPVVSASGKVHGSLLIAHDEPAKFDAETEAMVCAIAAHAAVAIENAELIKQAQREAQSSRQAQEAVAKLAAIVESSDDAIIGKTLDSTVQTWNASAERLFGYSAEEMIGQPLTRIIPEDRLHEEDKILENIRRGERIQHFETIRQHKDGHLIHVSVSVSPLRDADGVVVGASKIARNITAQKLAAEKQTLLLRETNHRIKNLFSVVGGLVSLSARMADSKDDLARELRQRIGALALAHDLTMPDVTGSTSTGTCATIFELLRAVIGPYEHETSRLIVTGEDMPLASRDLTPLALLFHEFATNAAKYGALSVDGGRLHIRLHKEGENVCMKWTERGGPAVTGKPETTGFGSKLEQFTLQASLRGTVERHWDAEGLTIDLRFPLPPVRTEG